MLFAEDTCDISAVSLSSSIRREGDKVSVDRSLFIWERVSKGCDKGRIFGSSSITFDVISVDSDQIEKNDTCSEI